MFDIYALEFKLYRMQVPEWIRHHFPKPKTLEQMSALLHGLRLHTICEEAKCPNIGECFREETATFLILGNICTRNCRFCAVRKGKPLPIDTNEPQQVAQAIEKLNLSHAVITSVTRDDLIDGGASQFAQTIKEIHSFCKSSSRTAPTVEVLLPLLNLKGLEEVISTHPEVINHNIETAERLYPEVRPNFRYSESLEFLRQTKKLDNSIITKSGFMLGLGETESEVIKMMKDLRDQKVDILTIGQYLRPSGRHLPVANYIHPDKFLEYKKIGCSLGFKYVVAGSYVRSSYKAKEALAKCCI